MKCFAITLPNNNIAQKQFARCKKLGDLYGWNVHKFDAIIGQHLTPISFSNEGLYLKPDTGIARKPKFQGAFMSHYMLWKQCVNDNFNYIILESDACITGPIPDLDLEHFVIKLHLDKGTETSEVTGKWSKGSYAYALSPTHAKMLIDNIKLKNVKPSDVCIGDKIVPWKHLDVDLVKHEKFV